MAFFNNVYLINILIFCALLISSFPTIATEKQQDEWPQNLGSLSLKELNDLQHHCSRMVEYEDLMLEGNIWTKHLREIELFQKKIREQPKDDEHLNCDSYQIRKIYINNKNPIRLDLHGISSAKAAQDKVLQFIRAAKSKRKNQVIVITGKGNHVNHRGDRGILFKSFPRWLENNENIIDFKARGDRGSYIVFLTPPSKDRADLDLLRYFQFFKENGHHFQRLYSTQGPTLPDKKIKLIGTLHELPLITKKVSKTQKEKKRPVPQKKLGLSRFPATVSHKKAKEYLNEFCKTQKKGSPQYTFIPELTPSMKTVVVTIRNLGRYSYQIEIEKRGYQQFLAQEAYKKITGLSAPKKQAKDLLRKTCQKKGYGVPEYQILDREFKVKVSIGDLVQEETSHISQVDAENRAAKKMYELLLKK